MTKLLVLLSLLVLCQCGINKYPGQPGVVTNNYSKIDLEFLDEAGLWVYETSYDNRQNGKGVAAIITKLYPNAQTYTSNARTNADGSFFWAKGQYEGSETQMISIPRLNQVILPLHSKVNFLLEYKISLDEIDDQNIAEYNAFSPTKRNPSPFGIVNVEWLTQRFNLLRAGQILPSGKLSYELVSAEVGDKKYSPQSVVSIETNFFQNGVRLNMDSQTRKEIILFLEQHFPQGYSGDVKFNVKNVATPFSVKLGLHTLKTAEAAGIQIIRDAKL